MKLLVYNLMFNKMAAVTKACAKLNAEIKILKKNELHDSIESLLDKSPNRKPGMDSSINPTELLIFDGFGSDELDVFLEEYKSTGIPKVLFKAMVTPINTKWSPSYLYEHLLDEVK